MERVYRWVLKRRWPDLVIGAVYLWEGDVLLGAVYLFCWLLE